LVGWFGLVLVFFSVVGDIWVLEDFCLLAFGKKNKRVLGLFGVFLVVGDIWVLEDFCLLAFEKKKKKNKRVLSATLQVGRENHRTPFPIRGYQGKVNL